MKILYVEDELSQNIERILKLFGSTILSNKQQEELNKLKNDAYGANNNEIKEIISRSGVLDVETDFCSALRKIEQDGEKYDLFIVDRQLAKDTDEYSLEDVTGIDPSYTQDKYEKYLSREGDYLFMRLLTHGLMPKCKMFYFMTAYTDTIKCHSDLEAYMDCEWFVSDQVLEKGNDEHLRRLCDIIEQSETLTVRYKFLPYFESFEKLDSRPEHTHLLVKIFKAQEKCKKIDRPSVLVDARVLLEAMVNKLCMKNNVPDTGTCNDNLTALGPYNARIQKGEGVISRPAMSAGKTLCTLCSCYGAHDGPAVPDDMFECVMYALRAFILNYSEGS